MRVHRSHVAGNEDPIVIGCNCQHLRIDGTARNYACSQPKIYRRLSSEESLPDVGIDISVGLKADFQASLGGASFFPSLKRSTMP